MEFYDREPAQHLDGTKIFQSRQDRQTEDEVAALLEAAWSCKLNHFGLLSPIDWYAVRAGRLIGLLELKSRNASVDAGANMFFSLRKWLALTMASVGMGVPGVFVVRFTDALRWIPVADINASAVRIAGCGRERRMRTNSAVEPVIDVPIQQMRSIKELLVK